MENTDLQGKRKNIRDNKYIGTMKDIYCFFLLNYFKVHLTVEGRTLALNCKVYGYNTFYSQKLLLGTWNCITTVENNLAISLKSKCTLTCRLAESSPRIYPQRTETTGPQDDIYKNVYGTSESSLSFLTGTTHM